MLENRNVLSAEKTMVFAASASAIVRAATANVALRLARNRRPASRASQLRGLSMGRTRSGGPTALPRHCLRRGGDQTGHVARERARRGLLRPRRNRGRNNRAARSLQSKPSGAGRWRSTRRTSGSPHAHAHPDATSGTSLRHTCRRCRRRRPSRRGSPVDAWRVRQGSLRALPPARVSADARGRSRAQPRSPVSRVRPVRRKVAE
jgi:hypothetical protein